MASALEISRLALKAKRFMDLLNNNGLKEQAKLMVVVRDSLLTAGVEQYSRENP
jgi:hypothetical protein